MFTGGKLARNMIGFSLRLFINEPGLAKNNGMFQSCSTLHRRFYSPQRGISWCKIKLRARATLLQKSRNYPKTRKSATNHFRLTRFGWQHRRSRFKTAEKRNRRRYLKKRHKGIGYVHQRDFLTMKKYFPKINFKQSSSPRNRNINFGPFRPQLPAHIG